MLYGAAGCIQPLLLTLMKRLNIPIHTTKSRHILHPHLNHFTNSLILWFSSGERTIAFPIPHSQGWLKTFFPPLVLPQHLNISFPVHNTLAPTTPKLPFTDIV